jgi:hypothetical protein
MSARDGFNAVVRQSFYGGNYSLLDNESCAPNPVSIHRGYWMSVGLILNLLNELNKIILCEPFLVFNFTAGGKPNHSFVVYKYHKMITLTGNWAEPLTSQCPRAK